MGKRPVCASRFPLHAGSSHPAGVIFLVIFVKIDVNQLILQGKDFFWDKPSSCPECGERLWWHGFVLAYLACIAEAVFFRRLRCPYCHRIHRLRPESHWQRFQSSITTIEQTIKLREQTGLWRQDLPRPRQRQWWHRLGKKVKLCLGLSFSGTLIDAFMQLITASAIPVSNVMQCGDQGG
ncbi:MAG: hypothetical protein A2494_02520 [Candidatus Lloydbacteria bacterium RIFOXYC12_FULL_46_25]|uniref:Uncharacterized protein n=1 Tax=Candidatus Lloydbacteria bacterium RIFOXYC12_FULL_46_25 TaxID=1798670 RepID=A0A1G2DSY8_9BACT|nr:MAG: hypothetical protein A2494_02520 [Candidatus Lloydbacteria bacterium RIFOXYC12_FULL_46_25]